VYGDKENGDINKKVETLKEGIEKYPEQEYFMQEMANHHLEKGTLDEGLAILNNVLTTTEKPYYMYLKGVFEYEKKDYNAANATFDKLIALNSDFSSEAYAMKGNIYFYPALKIVEENSALAMEDPKYNANEAKIKEAYELAQPFYEKAKELEPDNKTIWGQQLLSIYWALNKAEYEALEKELGY
jgi:tetratricopeptide (TPR) repeat protein